MFAIELDVGGQTIIRLNPGKYEIPKCVENNVHVYIICEDKRVADQVSTYDMSQEEIAQFHAQKSQKVQKKGDDRNDKNSDPNMSKQSEQSSQYTAIHDDDNDVGEGDQMGSVNQDNMENDILESDYVLLSEPVSLMSVTPITIKDSTESKGRLILYINFYLLQKISSYLF